MEMITKEDVVAISNGDTQWYVVVARAYALACHSAQIIGDKALIKRANREWLDFVDRITSDVHYDVCVAFATASLDCK